MCNPLALAGIAVAAGGSYMKSKQDQATAKSAEKSADRVLSRDMSRQRQLELQRKGQLEQALTRQSRPQQTADAAALEQEINRDYSAAIEDDYNVDNGGAPTQNAGSGQKIVNDEYKKRLVEALSFARQQSGAKARLGAPGEAALRMNIANQGNANQIGMNAALARGESAVAQSQAQRAYQRKMRQVGKFGIGDALQIAGSLASLGSNSLASGATAGATALSQAATGPQAPVGARFIPTTAPSPGLY